MVAGTIISVAIAWDAITDPIIGYLVDNSKSKYGKRRPWILKSLIPLGASLVLMFLKVDFHRHREKYILPDTGIGILDSLPLPLIFLIILSALCCLMWTVSV